MIIITGRPNIHCGQTHVRSRPRQDRSSNYPNPMASPRASARWDFQKNKFHLFSIYGCIVVFYRVHSTLRWKVRLPNGALLHTDNTAMSMGIRHAGAVQDETGLHSSLIGREVGSAFESGFESRVDWACRHRSRASPRSF